MAQPKALRGLHAAEQRSQRSLTFEEAGGGGAGGGVSPGVASQGVPQDRGFHLSPRRELTEEVESQGGSTPRETPSSLAPASSVRPRRRYEPCFHPAAGTCRGDRYILGSGAGAPPHASQAWTCGERLTAAAPHADPPADRSIPAPSPPPSQNARPIGTKCPPPLETTEGGFIMMMMMMMMMMIGTK